jgi:formylmethanofuran dehydrogenase subunit E
MKKPIFAYEPDDLMVFETVWKAERYIEPPDVNNRIYLDAEGKILTALVEEDSRGIERVIIIENSNSPYQPDELERIIKSSLQYLNYSEQELENKSLPELVIEILKYKTE